MKVVKIILAILFFCVTVFLGLGLLVNEISIETKVTVDRPVNATFQVFVDEDKMPKWLTGFKSIETIKETANVIDSEYRLVFEEDGKEIIFIEKVLEFTENERFVMKLDHEIMWVKTTVDFIKHPEGTEVVNNSVYRGKNWFWRSVMPLLKGNVEAHEKESYENLKKLVEQLYPATTINE